MYDIARNLPFGLREPSFGVARKAVSFALHEILPPDELEKLSQEYYGNSVVRKQQEGVFARSAAEGTKAMH